MPATTTAPAPAAAKGLRKINLGGIAQSAAKEKKGKTYPVLPDPDGQAADLVVSILEKSAQLEAIEGSLKIEKAELIALCKPHWFRHHHEGGAPASSVEVRAEIEDEKTKQKTQKAARVTFTSRYYGTADEDALANAAGDRLDRFFKQSFELKIDGDLIPDEKVEAVIGELQELFARHGVSGALSAKAVFVPKEDFHTNRHTAFTPDENMALDRVMPMVCQVKSAKVA